MNVIKYINNAGNETETQYTDKYSSDLLEYVKMNGSYEGFFFKIKITEDISNEWYNTHNKWKRAIDLIPYAKHFCIDETFNTAISKGLDMKDLELTLSLLIKRIDYLYKSDKDSGTLKASAIEKRRSKKTQDNTNNDELLTQAQQVLNILKKE